MEKQQRMAQETIMGLNGAGAHAIHARKGCKAHRGDVCCMRKKPRRGNSHAERAPKSKCMHVFCLWEMMPDLPMYLFTLAKKKGKFLMCALSCCCVKRGARDPHFDSAALCFGGKIVRQKSREGNKKELKKYIPFNGT